MVGYDRDWLDCISMFVGAAEDKDTKVIDEEGLLTVDGKEIVSEKIVFDEVIAKGKEEETEKAVVKDNGD